MGELWQRRAVRQMVLGLAPLAVLGAIVVAVLAVRFGSAREPLAAASEETTATVVRANFGESGENLEFEWTDGDGVEQTTTLTFPNVGDVDEGELATLHYEPDDTDNVYVIGDERTVHLQNIFNGLLLLVAMLVLAATATVIRIGRRRRAGERPPAKRKLTVVRSRMGLIGRTWLVVREPQPDAPEWWVPVYWDPALDTVDTKRSYQMHGAEGHRSLQVADIDGSPIWPSGRRRTKKPRGTITTVDTPYPDGSRDIGLRRQFRGDVAVILGAPFLGLLWAYVDGSGAGGFAAASVVMVGALLWTTSMYGSDPT